MRVVIVEDNRTNLEVLTQLIRRMPGIDVQGFCEAQGALSDALERACDLMIIDNVMPGMSGLELVRSLRGLPSHRHVPIIMITADADRSTRLAAIDAGATDFLAKPVDPIELRSRLTNLLALRSAQNQLEDRAVHLEAEVAGATAYLLQREEDMIYRLARAIEVRDHETGDHVERVARVAGIVATTMGYDAAFVRTLWLAAPLHDVGKIGISDAILNKPGKLDGAELARMQQHPMIGADILADGDSDMLRMAEQIARCHHEKWDGTGYPQGLAGEQIPIAARITAVADVLDALCSPRSYKPAWPAAKAREEILRGAGTHFDPACVAALDQAWTQIVPLYPSRLNAVDAA